VLHTQIRLITLYLDTRTALIDRGRHGWRDERGEITSTTITIAILAALALAVGAIIVAKVTAKANSIPTD
jgi:hypothetical protein